MMAKLVGFMALPSTRPEIHWANPASGEFRVLGLIIEQN